jgi:uncharacterized protein (DUF2141 family)
MNTKRIATVCLFFIMGFATHVFAQSETFSIEGELLFNNSGDIFISLVNEELFGTPMTGVQQYIIRIGPDEMDKKRVAYKFENVAPGVYGIRCFQDVNGNGILDKGMFGPKEPWGMSWQGDKPAKWPKFNHICFEVTADIKNLNIDLEE